MRAMNTLPKLQNAFQAYVHDPARRESGIIGEIVNDVRVPAGKRLGIYSEGYRLRLLEALLTDYPGLHALAGDDEFDAMGRAFIEANPSCFTNLRWYGGDLPAFLRTSEEYREYSVFAELADTTVLVAHHGSTKLRDAECAGTRLRRVGGSVFGVLIDPTRPGRTNATVGRRTRESRSTAGVGTA